MTASDGKALPPSPANHHYTRRELLQTGMIGIVGGMRSPARARALIDLACHSVALTTCPIICMRPGNSSPRPIPEHKSFLPSSPGSTRQALSQQVLG